MTKSVDYLPNNMKIAILITVTILLLELGFTIGHLTAQKEVHYIPYYIEVPCVRQNNAAFSLPI